VDWKLRRPFEDRIIGGVCGGLGQYFDIDTTLVRLAWVLLTLVTSGTGLFIYLLAWLIIPDEEGRHSTTAVVLVIALFLLLPLCGCCGLFMAMLTNSN
jgi:phage shock protein C